MAAEPTLHADEARIKSGTGKVLRSNASLGEAPLFVALFSGFLPGQRLRVEFGPIDRVFNSSNATGVTSICMSIRSISGPLTRPRSRCTLCGLHTQDFVGSFKYPHGHGFMLATNMKRAG